MPNGRIHFETPNHESRIAEGKKSWLYPIWVTHGLNIGQQIHLWIEEADGLAFP